MCLCIQPSLQLLSDLQSVRTLQRTLAFDYLSQSQPQFFTLKWVKGELALGPKNAAKVKKKALNEGMTDKEFRNAKKDAGVSSNKTDFDGGWNLYLSNPKHVR